MGNSRTKSSIMQKMGAWRRDPYRSDPMNRIWLNEKKCECAEKFLWGPYGTPHLGARCGCDATGEKIDKPYSHEDIRKASQKIMSRPDGGYDEKQRCGVHNMAYSASGKCSGCEMAMGGSEGTTRTRGSSTWRPPRRTFTAAERKSRRYAAAKRKLDGLT